MALVSVPGPACQRIAVVQEGTPAKGTQRSRCNHRDCPRTMCLLQYAANGRWPAVKQQSVAMTRNGRGVRDIGRVLRVRAATVLDVLKKKAPARNQGTARRRQCRAPPPLDVMSRQVEDAAVEERWRWGGRPSQQRWFWPAMAPQTGQVFAAVGGPRQAAPGCKLPAVLAPLGSTHFSTEGWGASRRQLAPAQHTVGKQDTPKIARTHTPLWARIKRIVRKPRGLSRSLLMHDLVIGLGIHRSEFGYAV